jgi:uncharacterized membrane protein
MPQNDSAGHGLSSGDWAGIGVIIAVITLVVALITLYYQRRSVTDLAKTLRVLAWHVMPREPLGRRGL